MSLEYAISTQSFQFISVHAPVSIFQMKELLNQNARQFSQASQVESDLLAFGSLERVLGLAHYLGTLYWGGSQPWIVPSSEPGGPGENESGPRLGARRGQSPG